MVVQEYPIKNTQEKQDIFDLSRVLAKVKATRKERGIIDETLIFDDPNLSHGFTQVPNCVLKDKRLSVGDKLLYILLLMFAWQQAHCFPGQDTLAEYMDCDRRTVLRSMSHLKTFNLIQVERRGLGKVNIYHIKRLSAAYARAYVDKGSRG